MRSFVNPRFAALAGLFLALSLAYNLTIPLFEAPDERDHVDYADWLASGNGLPHLVSDRDEVGEIWQPPLYYALTALFIAPIDRSDLESIAPLSDDWRAGLSRVAHYHTAAEAFPFRDSALAVHVGRAVSAVLGLITVMATYAIARRVIPTYAIVAAALVALNPQFIFISSAVNNDNLVIALCSVALWMVVRLITDPPAQPRDERRQVLWFIALGLVWGLAALTKLTGLTLGLVIGLALLYLARRDRSWWPLVLGGLFSGATMLLVCGWWFGRNWQLYGDPLAWDQMLAVTGGLVRPELLPWPETLQYATFLRYSYWAMFGYGIPAPAAFYWLVTAIMILALVGLIVRPFRVPRGERMAARATLWILAVWSATILVFLLRWMRQIDATNQGRLLYPAIAAISVLAAVGLASLDGRRRWLGTTAAVVLGCWAAALPMLTIAPAFAQPRPLSPADVANLTDIRFGEAIRLVGYDLPATAEPGQPLAVSLYWQTDVPLDESFIVALRILDPVGQPAAGLDTLPAGGRYSTVVWEPGRPFHDTYQLPSISTDAVPGLGTLLVIVYPRGEPGAPLPVTAGGTAAGNEARVGAIKLAQPPVTLEPPRETAATFDGRFRLLGHDIPDSARPGETMGFSLYWEALAPDGQDYTVFIHLVNEAGELVAQSDGPPRGGTYPTSIWDAGEQVADARAITLPPELPAGRYMILAGLYNPAAGTRLPAYDAGDGRHPNDAVVLSAVQVLEPIPEN